MTKELLEKVLAAAIKHKEDHGQDAPVLFTFEKGCSFMHGLMEGEVERLKAENDRLRQIIQEYGEKLF